MSSIPERHIALQFGHIKHFNEGLSEFSRQLAGHMAEQAGKLQVERNWHLHFILPEQWHGMFGDRVHYHALSERMRWPHRFPVDLDVWHGLHQHMRYRPPFNCRTSVMTVHDLNHLQAKEGLSLWWQALRLGRQFARTDRLIAISQFVAEDITRNLPASTPPLVIHNGASDLTLTVQQAPKEAPLPGTYLLHISRMAPSKNVGSLLEMLATWPNQMLVLAGPDSAEITAHRQHARRLGLSNVRFLTDVSEAEKAWLYAHCSAFLFPSLQEGFGLPPIEAMYFGKPVIVAQRTCLPEICGAGAAYWQDFDPQHMRRIVEDRIAAHASEPSIHQHVRQQAMRYTWSRAATQYLALYANAMT